MKIKIPLMAGGFYQSRDSAPAYISFCRGELSEYFNLNKHDVDLILSSKSTKDSYLVKLYLDTNRKSLHDYIEGLYVKFLDVKGLPSVELLDCTKLYLDNHYPELIGKTFYVSIEDA